MNSEETLSSRDPTDRTIDTLYREIENLRNERESALNSFKHLVDEKFASIRENETLVERGRVENKADTKEAVAAALTAQKEAVKEQTLASEKSIAKSEAATAKQIDQLQVNFNQAISAASNTIADVKERVITIETIKTNTNENLTHTKDRMNTNINSMALAAMIVVPLVTTILIKFVH